MVLLAACDESALDGSRFRDAGADGAAIGRHDRDGGSQPPAGRERRPQPADPPAPAQAIAGTITRVDSAASVPLAGPRVDAKAGDWMLRNEGTVAVLSTAKGRIVDFGPEGGRDGMYYVEAVAFDALDRMHVEVERIEPAGEHALYVKKRVLDKPLVLHAWVWFDGPKLRLSSMLTSTGPATLAVTLGEVVAWGNTPTWAEGRGWITASGSFGTAFLARQAQGLAYAIGATQGRLYARFSAPDLPGFHESARTGEEVVSIPEGGASPLRTVELTCSSRSLGDAAMALASTSPAKAFALPPLPADHAPAGLALEVARCAPGAASEAAKPISAPPRAGPRPDRADTSARTAAADDDAPREEPFARFAVDGGRREISLPQGCLRLRFVAPGHRAGAWFSPGADAPDDLMPAAGTLEWRVTERGGDAAVPAKLVVRGIAPTPDPEWGDEPDAGAAVDTVYSEGEGRRPLPPGRYHVIVTRGPEYTIDERDVTVAVGKSVRVSAVVEHAVDTRGYVSADLHVHADPSFDAPTLLEDRVRSLAAVGVDVAVATDHNAVTDYGPAIEHLSLGKRLASIVGDEVTTKEVLFGHFNVFPLVAGTAPIPFERIAPSELFAAARGLAKPGIPFVVQVNHPRMGDIGYLELLRFDRGDVEAWTRRAKLFAAGFDAIEIFNGDHYAEIGKVERCLDDWYALLNAGIRVVATGNSDSHKIVYQEAGVPRNWIAAGADDASSFDERLFLEALKAGRVVVSSGPFVRLEANGQPIGATVGAGSVTVSVQVDAPPWIDVDRVDLVRRGVRAARWRGPFPAGPHRFAATTPLELAPGDWIVAIVRGRKPMTHLHRSGATPFAFTNPIFVGP